MFRRPSAVLGTVSGIFLRRVDPPRVTDVKGKIPVRRANRLRATELKRDLPARRLGPLCTAASGDRMIPASRPPLVTTRAPPSIGGVDVGVRISLCVYDLTRRIPVGMRRINQSCTTGMKGIAPIRKIIQSCAAGAPGSEGMIPIRRVNRSYTTTCEGKREDPILIGLLSRHESRCPKRDTTERTRMPLDAPEVGARRGRNRCAEIEVFPSPHGFWTWQDRHDWDRIANFIPPWHGCCDWTHIFVVTFEQSDLVSSPFDNPIHLFSPLPDLAVTNLLRWKGTTPLHRLKSSWETPERVLRTPQGSDHTPALTLGDCYHYDPTRVSIPKYPTAARSGF